MPTNLFDGRKSPLSYPYPYKDFIKIALAIGLFVFNTFLLLLSTAPKAPIENN
jgi:hypothetical protein